MQLKSTQYIARPPIQLLHRNMNDNKFMRETSYLTTMQKWDSIVSVTVCSRVLLSIIHVLTDVLKMGACYSMGQ